jgi:hypothetical protein
MILEVCCGTAFEHVLWGSHKFVVMALGSTGEVAPYVMMSRDLLHNESPLCAQRIYNLYANYEKGFVNEVKRMST